MAADTSLTLEIADSRWKLAGLTALSILMNVASVFAIWAAITDIPNGGYVTVALACGAALFFALTTVVIIRRLVQAGEPLITLTPEGIRDTRLSAALIPWRAVRGISTWTHYGQKVMVLDVDPSVIRQLPLNPLVRWTLGLNRLLGIDGLGISALGLTIGYEALLQAAIAYAEAAQRPEH